MDELDNRMDKPLYKLLPWQDKQLRSITPPDKNKDLFADALEAERLGMTYGAYRAMMERTEKT